MCVRCVVRFFGRLHRNSAGILDVWQGISGQYDGKSASRLRAKPSGGLYAVFPYILIEETEKIRHNYLKSLVNTSKKVLFENEIKPGIYQGYTKSYLPVRMKYDRNIVGEELEVKITNYCDEFCIAE